MRDTARSRWFLLTGRPGSGKTTIIRLAVGSGHVKVGGFYTEEIRVGGLRSGFRLVTFDGRHGVLARRGQDTTIHRVGAYSVNVDVIEELAIPALDAAMKSADLVVIDEIGKMEMLHPGFVRKLDRIASTPKPVLGTILMTHHPEGDRIKALPFAEIHTVTPSNRNAILCRVHEWLGGIASCC